MDWTYELTVHEGQAPPNEEAVTFPGNSCGRDFQVLQLGLARWIMEKEELEAEGWEFSDEDKGLVTLLRRY